MADLTAGGRPCNGFTVHKYVPWDPEEFVADKKQHLAVWPMGEAEESEPLATGSHQLKQQYVVSVWEATKEESARLKRNETKGLAFLDLHNAVRARFYVEANQMLGASPLVWYGGSVFPDRIQRVRYFQIALNVRRFQEFTA